MILIISLYYVIFCLLAGTCVGNRCCRFLEDAASLLVCVNTTLTEKFIVDVLDGSHDASFEGPVLNLALLTRTTMSIAEYGAHSLLVKAAYAEHNGYTHIPLLPDTSTPDYILHRKLVPLLDAMEGSLRHFDYIVWMDADAIPLQMSLRFEAVAAAHPHADLLISKDISSLVNSGVIIVRNRLSARRLLKLWLNARTSREGGAATPTDQIGFEVMYNSLTANDRRRIVILSEGAINSEAPPMKYVAHPVGSRVCLNTLPIHLTFTSHHLTFISPSSRRRFMQNPHKDVHCASSRVREQCLPPNGARSSLANRVRRRRCRSPTTAGGRLGAIGTTATGPGH